MPKKYNNGNSTKIWSQKKNWETPRSRKVEAKLNLKKQQKIILPDQKNMAVSPSHRAISCTFWGGGGLKISPLVVGGFFLAL